MSDGSRRFTDREVSLVLRRASEIEESVGEEAGRVSGLSLAELEEIGREVGISAESLRRAVAGLERSPPLMSRLAGAPLVQRAVHAVPARLDEAAVRELVAIVDRDVEGAGGLSEALGSVRWTASDRLRDTQVRISPADDQTTIEVVEKTKSRLRLVMQGIPVLWGVIAAMPVFASGVSAPIAVAVAAASAVAGGLMGRGAWTQLARRSDARVHRLAADLAERAAESLSSASTPSVRLPAGVPASDEASQRAPGHSGSPTPSDP